MSLTYRILAGVCALSLSIGLAVTPTLADSQPQKDLCKNGGYGHYWDPTTPAPFSNQGRCIAFVNAGGTLLPVRPPPLGVVWGE